MRLAFAEKIENGLKIRAATPNYFNCCLGFFERDDFSQLGVKLHCINTFDAVFEKTVDYRIKLF